MTRTDVAIIGGGIIGCLIARELITRAPGISITVLDRDLVGSGASRRSAGLHFPRGATARVREMTALSQNYYERLAHDNPALPIYPVEMSVLTTTGVGNYLSCANAIRVSALPGDLAPVPEGTGVWNVEGGQYADVGALAVALAADLRAQVHFREATAVSAIDPSDNDVLLRLGNGESLCAATVILAPGPWVHAPAWQALTAQLDVRVKLVAALHIDKAPTHRDRAIVFQDIDAFLLPLAHRGHWLFSFTSQQWNVQPDHLLGGMTDTCMKEGRAALDAVAPHLAAAAAGGRVFCDAYSHHREPLIQSLDDNARLVFAGAANGSGYRLAPAIAAETVNLLLSDRDKGPVDDH
ncbi:FAD-dependent oxidoreductase [Nocardia sp. NBC_01499]|uniref:FAD-dependent oxidoreductase n=1 Tax=Nocardia sp. NBC_01499 TaxID=2903597 RepID=UPI003864C94B